MKDRKELLCEIDILEKEVKKLNGMVIGLQNIIAKPAMSFDEMKESVKREKSDERMKTIAYILALISVILLFVDKGLLQ